MRDRLKWKFCRFKIIILHQSWNYMACAGHINASGHFISRQTTLRLLPRVSFESNQHFIARVSIDSLDIFLSAFSFFFFFFFESLRYDGPSRLAETNGAQDSTLFRRRRVQTTKNTTVRMKVACAIFHEVGRENTSTPLCRGPWAPNL